MLSGTPLWVFFVFIYLVFIGIKATKDRTIYIGKMFLMPSVFFALFLIRLVALWRWDIFLIFLVALFISLALSYFFLRIESMKVEQSHVFVKGSYETLIVVMVIFFIKYYLGYMKAMGGELEKYLIAEIIVSGVTTGFFLNKIIRYAGLICFKQ
jgi:hypothetical protein